MVEVFREVRRVLRDDGTLWLNLGDCYATGAGKVGNCPGGGLIGERFKRHFGKSTPGSVPAMNGLTQPNRLPIPGLKPKDLIGIPWRVALALQADGWWLRSACPWIKRNCMPESCKDRSATAIEYVFLLTKSQRYFYDHEAVKIEASPDSHARYGRARSTDHKYADADRKYFKSVKLLGGVVAGVNPKARKVPSNWDQDPGHHEASHRKGRAPRSKQNESFSAAVKDVVGSRARRNSDWFMTSWQGLLSDDDGDPMAFIVNPKGFKEAHFATFPPMLVEPCVKAGTSEKGCCPECGAPWVRVTGKPERVQGRVSGNLERKISAEGERSRTNTHMGSSIPWETTVTPTLAWRPTCTHGHEPIPCVVLDPFGGSGTVGNVARDLGRSFILIELKPEYCEMSKRRVEDLTTPVEVVRRG